MLALRKFIFTFSAGRAASILFLLVMLFLCSIHITGTNHDVDSNGLGLIDGLSAGIILVALIAILAPLSSMNRFSRRPLMRWTSMPATTVHFWVSSCPEAPLRR
ncbi:hypothetical protein BH20ACT22_BH20ACT22_23850 [soil metagenome]